MISHPYNSQAIFCVHCLSLPYMQMEMDKIDLIWDKQHEFSHILALQIHRFEYPLFFVCVDENADAVFDRFSVDHKNYNNKK